MCACGCFLVIAIAAGVAFLILHGLWYVAVAVLIATALIGWFAKDKFKRSATKPS